MATTAQWIEGARPRTLGAAVAPVVVGTAVAGEWVYAAEVFVPSDAAWSRAVVTASSTVALSASSTTTCRRATHGSWARARAVCTMVTSVPVPRRVTGA